MDVNDILTKAKAKLNQMKTPIQGGNVPPPQGLNPYAIGQNLPSQYVPVPAGRPTLAGKQFALQEAEKTGYYAPAEMRSMLDQIQQNKNLNMSTQDEAQRQQAQQQNHALYGQLQKYGIDGESQFNTSDNAVNAQNLANAYKGVPTMAKKAQDWQQEYQKNSQDLAGKQFGLSQSQFDFSKDKYNDSDKKSAYTNAFIEMVSGYDNPQDAYKKLADYYNDPSNADKPIDAAKIAAVIQSRFKPTTTKQQDMTKYYKLYMEDKKKDESFSDWFNRSGLGK